VEATRKAIRPPEDRIARYEPGEHRTFYRDGGVWITDRWMTIHDRRYQVGSLNNLRAVREPADSVAASVGMACAVAVAVAAFVVLAGDPILLLGSPLLAAVPVGIAIVAWRLRRRSYVLYADYNGREVQVLRGPDQRRFNQICRALVRAREYDREHMY
jgi:hypothetical protein